MKLDIRREQVWVAPMGDKSGALAEKLEQLAAAGANLDFLIARRVDKPAGRGVVFVTPVRGPKQQAAAKKAGFHKSESIHGLSVGCKDAPGYAATITRALAEAKINLRGFSGAAVGKRAVLHLALDSESDVTKARKVMNKIA